MPKVTVLGFIIVVTGYSEIPWSILRTSNLVIGKPRLKPPFCAVF